MRHLPRDDEAQDARRRAAADYIAALEHYRVRCFEVHARLLAQRDGPSFIESLDPRTSTRARDRGIELAFSSRVEMSHLRAAETLLVMHDRTGSAITVAKQATQAAMDFMLDIGELVQRDPEEATKRRDAWNDACDASIAALVADVSP